jgi:hypothetical protein
LESEFCCLAQLSPCRDEDFCKGTALRFTEEPNAEIYGRIDRNRNLEDCYRATDNHFEACAQSGLQVLYMQDCILRLLLDCSKTILHDIEWSGILNFTVVAEPPLSDILDRDEGQVNFKEILMLAPYRG